VSALRTPSPAVVHAVPAFHGHSARVTAYAEALAEQLGWEAGKLDEVRLGSSLHDVGKLTIEAEVLCKPGPLDATEWEQLRWHPTAGAFLIVRVATFRRALPYVLFHHERWDGAGYPTGRAGTEIPIEARLIAVADAFDAMTSARPYREAVSAEVALEEIERCAGTQFDPEVAAALVEVCCAGALV
jgi:HD-GYP domain-containing protein (c-di-GMP phosphodiesterase class II)